MGQTSLLERWTINRTEKKNTATNIKQECEVMRRGENKAGGP